MMATLLWASSFLLASSFLASAQEEYCYALDEDPYDLHSDYTSYFEVQNTEAEPVEFEGVAGSFGGVSFVLCLSRCQDWVCPIPDQT